MAVLLAACLVFQTWTYSDVPVYGAAMDTGEEGAAVREGAAEDASGLQDKEALAEERQADGVQQDPDPVVKEFPGLVEVPCEYSVDTVPDQKVQEGIGDHTGNIKGRGPSDPVTDYPEHIHNKKVLADGQGIEDCDGSQPLPDASMERQEHQDGEPDQINRYVKKIVGKYDQSGDYRTGKIDD